MLAAAIASSIAAIMSDDGFIAVGVIAFTSTTIVFFMRRWLIQNHKEMI